MKLGSIIQKKNREKEEIEIRLFEIEDLFGRIEEDRMKLLNELQEFREVKREEAEINKNIYKDVNIFKKEIGRQIQTRPKYDEKYASVQIPERERASKYLNIEDLQTYLF